MKQAFWRFKEYVAFAIAGLLGLLGLMIALLTTIYWSGGGRGSVSLVIGVCLGVLPMLVAFWLFRSVWHSSARRRSEWAERQTLKLAARVGGRLTPLQVARRTHLTLEESNALLNRLGVEGHCRMELAENGVISYHFGP